MKKLSVFVAFLCVCLGAELEFDTLQSDFEQIITSKNEQISYSGHFVADAKNGAFWRYEKPSQKLIYFSRARVIVVEPRLEQAIISDLKQTPDIRKIFSSARKTAANEFVAEFDGTEYRIHVKNGIPDRIQYTDKLDNDVVINLRQTIKNAKFDKSLLEPKIPSNYDILTN